MSQKALLLIGSAKTPHSTSESLGTYLFDRLKEKGFETEVVYLHRILALQKDYSVLLEKVEISDLIIFSCPLYVDSLPYLVIKTMELIREDRISRKTDKKQKLAAILNNGFPEARQNETAIAICKLFASKAGFEWAGGLALGGGEAINGKPLYKIKGMARNIIKSLDLTADALSQNKPVPVEAIKLMAKPLINDWLYVLMGNFGWKQRAKKYGAKDKLYSKPYKN